MSHPHKKEAHASQEKKLVTYGGKSKGEGGKQKTWSGLEALNTNEQAGLPIINKEPSLSEETAPRIMRKSGGHVKGATSLKRLDKPMRKGRASGGKAMHEDVAEDKKLVNKMVKAECRTGRASGGRMSPVTINISDSRSPGGGLAGLGAGLGGPANTMPPPPPPAPPPMGGMPPGGMPMMPPGAPMGAPPMGSPPMGLGGAMPPPPPQLPPPGGQMGGMPPRPFKKGGRVRTTDDMTAGAGSGEGRLEKIELQGGSRKGFS